MESFSSTAKDLSASPLGIIALFIVMLYAFASLVTTFSGSFSSDERIPLIYFLVVFPFVVLGVFGWLVSQHSTKLYAPKDFKNEDNYIRTAVLLAAAQARSPNSGDNISVDVAAIVANVQKSARSDTDRVYSRKKLLWVDDMPENNVFARKAFESAGFEITLALTTDQALEAMKIHAFSAIISDMGRREGPREGYNLLAKIRTMGDKTPFYIYAGSNKLEHKQEAAAAGAQGSTNDPNELYGLVIAATR